MWCPYVVIMELHDISRILMNSAGFMGTHYSIMGVWLFMHTYNQFMDVNSFIMEIHNSMMELFFYFILFFYFKYIYTGYNQSVTNCSTLEPCPKNRSIFTVCMQNNSFHIIMIYTVIW